MLDALNIHPENNISGASSPKMSSLALVSDSDAAGGTKPFRVLMAEMQAGSNSILQRQETATATEAVSTLNPQLIGLNDGDQTESGLELLSTGSPNPGHATDPSATDPGRLASAALADPSILIAKQDSLLAPTVSAISIDSPLKRVSLGAHLTLITSQQPVSDQDSLHQFARQQGLDETTIEWLLSPTPDRDAGLIPGTSLNSNPSPVASPSELDIIAADTASKTMQFPPALLANFKSSEIAASPLAMGQSAGGILGATVSQRPIQEIWRPGTPSSLAEETRTQGQAMLTFFQQPSPAGTELKGHKTGDLSNLVSSTADRLVDFPGPGKVTMPTESELDLTTRIGDALPSLLRWINGPSGGPSPWSGLGSTGSDRAVDAELADGEAKLTESNLAARLAKDSPNLPSPQARGTDGKGSEDRPAFSLAGARLTGQELADKMSQALGQRMLQAFEKGEWQVKFNLKPAELGQVEVNIQMKDNSLQAHLSASQSVVRDLLESGLGRLKETLQQSGMDVASIKVNDGQSSRSGEDPTPRQGRSGSEKATHASGKDPSPAQTSSQASHGINDDGSLDLMV